MENFFILLELPFDPPEEDTGKINEAISKKRAQWASDQTNPLRRTQSSQYLESLDEIRAVMLDPVKRAAEAKKAKQLKVQKTVELETKLALYRSKGAGLSDKDLKRLMRSFGPYGFTETEIQQRFGDGAQEEEKLDLSEVLDRSQAKSIRTSLQQLDEPDQTLYDLLGLSPHSTCTQLCEAADAKKRKILDQGEHTGQDNAIQALCGQCAIIFKDPAGKRRYDNYLHLTRFSIINDAVDELARSNFNRIEPRMKETVIDIAVQQCHLSVPDASVYIDLYCEYMGYTVQANKVICGLCEAENPPGATHCANCGKPLIIVCPACGTENNNAAHKCAKCGFDLTQMDRAIELLQQARQRYAGKDLDEAENLVRQAAGFWPNHAEIQALETSIQAERSRRSATIEAIMQDVQEKRLYGAQTKIQQARANGFQIDSSLASRVSQSIREVETKLAAMRNASGDQAFTIAMGIADLVSDSAELERSLQAFPPEKVPGITSRYMDDEVALSWRACPSIGKITYRLVRKEGTWPNDASDGTCVYEGHELTYTDHEAPKNAALYYAVYAVRIGVLSPATRLDQPVAIVEPVKHLTATGADQRVTLAWDKLPGASEIRVFQYCGAARPANDDAYRSIPCTRTDGLIVQGLDNGMNYWFAVQAGYRLNGIPFCSRPSYISAIPLRPAKPLQGFSVQVQDGTLLARWAPSEWDVILFWSKGRPNYTVGMIYALDDLAQYGRIDMHLHNATEGDFRLDLVGECYIIPGVINNSNVILSEPVYFSSVPPVKDITFDMNVTSSVMYVDLTWPSGIERVVLLYRTDTYPEGINDPLATKIECSKKRYDLDQGIAISDPVSGITYAQIYSCVDTEDGHRIYSGPCRAMLRNEPQREVLYTLRYKKGGLRSKQCLLTLELETAGSCMFPAFVIVSKYNSTPFRRSDGVVVGSVETDLQLNGRCSVDFETAPLRAGTRLKLFFLDDKQYKSFKIACKAGSTI